MYIYRKTPLKGDTRTSPLLKIALGFAQQGWPILPVRPFICTRTFSTHVQMVSLYAWPPAGMLSLTNPSCT